MKIVQKFEICISLLVIKILVTAYFSDIFHSYRSYNLLPTFSEKGGLSNIKLLIAMSKCKHF